MKGSPTPVHFSDAIDETGRLRDISSMRAVPLYVLPDVYIELQRRRDAQNCSMNDVIAGGFEAYDQLAIITRQRLVEILVVRDGPDGTGRSAVSPEETPRPQTQPR